MPRAESTSLLVTIRPMTKDALPPIGSVGGRTTFHACNDPVMVLTGRLRSNELISRSVQEEQPMDYAVNNAANDTEAGVGKRRRKPRIRVSRSARAQAKGEKPDQRGRPTTGRIVRILYGQS